MAKRQEKSDAQRRVEHDDWIRLFGFSIARRPKEGTAIWQRNGKEYLEREAVIVCRVEAERMRAKLEKRK